MKPAWSGRRELSPILIDRLLNAHTVERFGDVRPAAVNVIEGKVRDVMALLEELAGFGSTPGRVSWRRRAPQSVFGRHVAAKRANQGD